MQESVYLGIDNESWYLNCTLINFIWDLFSYFIKHHYRDFNLVINSLHWWFETLKLYPTHSKILTATQKHRLKWPKIFFHNIFQIFFEDFYGKIWSWFRPLSNRKLDFLEYKKSNTSSDEHNFLLLTTNKICIDLNF